MSKVLVKKDLISFLKRENPTFEIEQVDYNFYHTECTQFSFGELQHQCLLIEFISSKIVKNINLNEVSTAITQKITELIKKDLFLIYSSHNYGDRVFVYVDFQNIHDDKDDLAVNQKEFLNSESNDNANEEELKNNGLHNETTTLDDMKFKLQDPVLFEKIREYLRDSSFTLKMQLAANGFNMDKDDLKSLYVEYCIALGSNLEEIEEDLNTLQKTEENIDCVNALSRSLDVDINPRDALKLKLRYPAIFEKVRQYLCNSSFTLKMQLAGNGFKMGHDELKSLYIEYCIELGSNLEDIEEDLKILQKTKQNINPRDVLKLKLQDPVIFKTIRDYLRYPSFTSKMYLAGNGFKMGKDELKSLYIEFCIELGSNLEEIEADMETISRCLDAVKISKRDELTSKLRDPDTFERVREYLCYSANSCFELDTKSYFSLKMQLAADGFDTSQIDLKSIYVEYCTKLGSNLEEIDKDLKIRKESKIALDLSHLHNIYISSNQLSDNALQNTVRDWMKNYGSGIFSGQPTKRYLF